MNLGCLNASASVAAWRATHPNHTVTDLYKSFQDRVHTIAKTHNKTVTTWADVFMAFNTTWPAAGAPTPNKTKLPSDARVQVWGGEPSVADVVRAGYDVIRSAGYYLNGGFSTGGCGVIW